MTPTESFKVLSHSVWARFIPKVPHKQAEALPLSRPLVIVVCVHYARDNRDFWGLCVLSPKTADFAHPADSAWASVVKELVLSVFVIRSPTSSASVVESAHSTRPRSDARPADSPTPKCGGTTGLRRRCDDEPRVLARCDTSRPWRTGPSSASTSRRRSSLTVV